MSKKQHFAYLLDLGLNQLEAEVYLALLPEEPMTAYRIGKLIGKPTANVYKAIDVLARKGAVIIEEGKNRKCKAVKVEIFVAQLKSDFEKKAIKAAKALTNIQKETYDEHIYQIQSVPLAIEQAKEMLRNAQQIVVIDVFPKPLQLILPEIRNAINRGVEVFIETYQPIEIRGAYIAIPTQWKRTLNYWNSQQLNLVVDGKEYIAALFSNDLENIYQANWSCNLYLACLMHSGRMSEHRLVSLLSETNQQKKETLLSDESFFYNDQVPGVKALFQRHQKSNHHD